MNDMTIEEELSITCEQRDALDIECARLEKEVEVLRRDAERWQAMRQTLVAADFAPEMGGGPVVMFSCHAERVGFGPEGADAIADAAVAAMNGANA